ncbi:alpha-(1-_3)-arabinofuranosyltransferase domain-containing protein [Geodermatophilus amargosae]|uniref:alpha-(1->3)-arabinofuranosyltransferase domain-containing protein n=1 Tax=Geodermatophilus amargosae TaxID=1296565 RepID=UPI0034DE7F45
MTAPPLTTEPAGTAPAGSVASQAPPAPAQGPPSSALLRRMRLATVCVGFLGLALTQSPGRVLPDTKLDLAVDPAGFLGRALQLWEPEGFAGQVQNQAYGYLFPMGPFFALGDAVGLPAWVVQRLWLAVLLSTAFLGVVVLAGRLRIGTPAAAVVGGLAYALAPRMVTALGATSVEVVPMAVAPWVLVPLVGVAAARSPRRAAALSGLAVLCAGGVNAVAASAVLPLPVLWLLTRPGGPLRRRLAAWWAGAVLLATAWWAGPLLLLGRYSPPFLDHIENADVTTTPTDVLSTLRGVDHWVAYLGSATGPLWPAGWSLVADTLPAAGTLVLAAAGLWSLTRRDLPERTWLVLGLLAGVALVTLGHLAPVDGLLAGPLNAALDGALAPLRNVHKFDPVLRLPLALALVHLVGVLVRRARERTPADRPRWPAGWRPAWPGPARPAVRAVLAVVVLGLVATASPALAGRLAPPAGFEGVPGYWDETAAYLASAQPDGRALLVPASSFGTYVWGSPQDEPLQPLADSPWDVRNAVPLTPAGHVRVLDAVERRLADGEGSAGLTRYLARAGFSHLVLRNDLDTGAADATRPVLVRQALRNSPGITPVAVFGPRVSEPPYVDGIVLDAGLVEPAPAIEVYAVDDPAPRAWTAPLADTVTVSGGPDAVLALEDRGLVTDRPTVQAGRAPAGTGPGMVGDALVRRERTFGRIGDATSAALAPGDPRRLTGPARDYAVDAPAQAETVVRYAGGTPSASSAASDAGNLGGSHLDASPWAALDGDPGTAWRPADVYGEPEAAWWRLTADAPFRAAGVTVTLAPPSAEDPPAQVRLTTDTGTVTRPLRATAEPQDLPLPAGTTRTVTLGVDPAEGDAGAGLALAEVVLPGVGVTRSLVTPAPDGEVAAWAFDALGPDDSASGCVVDAAGRPRCAAALAEGAEETSGLDRVFTAAEAADADLALTARARPGAALDAMLAAAGGADAAVAASSSAVDDPRGSALAAVDGDPATAWQAEAGDRSPTLTLTWPGPRTVDSLRVVTTPGLAASFPTAVTIRTGGLPRTLDLDETGTARFAPLTTERLEVAFELPLELRTLDPTGGRVTPLGVGVSELEVGGANPLLDPAAEVTVPCGDGPVVTVDGEPRDTAVTTTVGALRELARLDLEVCDGGAGVALDAGEHRLVAAGTDVLAVRSATLTVAAPAPSSGRAAATVTRWEAEHRTVEVAAREEATLLVVPENTNPGWRATLEGEVLETVAVDGWQQGYVLPPGAAGTVSLDFAPGTAYRTALTAGAGAVLLLTLLAVLPVRRPRPAGEAGRRGRGAVVPVVLAAVAGTALAGGVVGLSLLAGAVVAGGAVRARRSAVLGGVAAGAVTVAGVLLLAAPGATGTARQVLALAALAAVVASVLPPGRLPPRRLHPDRS